jgi:hypothetical protein
MIKKDFVRHIDVRRRTLVIVMALMAPLAGLGVAGTALAKEPTGEFAIFNQCPRFTAGITDCVYNVANSGEMTYNKLTVPIVNPITFQFGFEGAGSGIHIVGALNGETMSPTPEKLPGGLSSLIDCDEIRGGWLTRALRNTCRRLFDHTRFQAVNVITELARPASEIFLDTENELFEEGVGFGLPVKVRLENPLLGNHCYIGSSAKPIMYELTTGTTNPPLPNKPISGKQGDLGFNESFTLITISNHTTLDNAFSVPAAKGCGGFLSFLVDRLIDNKVGLPSSAGHNTIIFNTTGHDADAGNIIKTEK